MTTATEPTTKTADAEALLLEAALDLAAYYKTNGNGYRQTIADAIRQAINHGSSDLQKAWAKFERALDVARAAEEPCGDCEGTGQVSKSCCTGSLARIECGCHGELVSAECTTCDERGWVL